MLTEEEINFISYWEAKRIKKKNSVWQFSLGLPLGVLIITAVFINVISGWHKRAAAVIQGNESMIVTVLVAAVGIVVFISIFSMRHQWDQQEQRYQELLYKKDSDAAKPVTNLSNQ